MDIHEPLLFKLKLLSNIQIGDKLNIIENEIGIDKYSHFQFLNRWYNQSNREKSIIYINDMLNQLKITLDQLLNEAFIISVQTQSNNNIEENILLPPPPLLAPPLLAPPLLTPPLLPVQYINNSSLVKLYNLEETKKSICSMYIQSIDDSIIGIKNLKYTYRDDIKLLINCNFFFYNNNIYIFLKKK